LYLEQCLSFFPGVMSSSEEAVGSGPHFQYGSLAEHHFRVIEISSINPIITIELADYADNSPPEYCALSYAWGSQANTEEIICNDKVFNVSPHLHEGLRSIGAASPGIRLWIDAICINQTSNVEKASQVAKMHHIYRKAQGVYVWLGKEEHGSDKVMDAINDLEISPEPELSHTEMLLKILRIKSETPKLFDVSLFTPLAALSNRSWFQRLWIVQEYYFARSLRLFCGWKQVDGTKFIKTLQNLSMNSFGTTELPIIAKDDALFSGFVGIRSLEKIKISRMDSARNLSFFDLVVLGRTRSAKEPVDHVYALLGMVEELDEVYQKEIPIDYSEDATSHFWKLYIIFGKVALQHERHLRLLSIVSSEERHKKLPSWCPDLRSTMTMSNLNDDSSYRAGWMWDGHSTSSGFQDCSAHNNFKGAEYNHVSVSFDSDIIQILGVALGLVKAIGPRKQWTLDMYTDDISKATPFAKAVLDWLSDCEEFVKQHWKGDETALHIWNEVLVGAGNGKRRPKKKSDEQIILRRPKKIENDDDIENTADNQHTSQSIDATERSAEDADYDEEADFEEQVIDPAEIDNDGAYTFLRSRLTEIVNLDPAIDWKEQNPGLLRDLQACYVWLLFIAEIWNKRVLFATSNGYIGFSTEEIAVGDTAAVLYSGQTLYILRELGSEYRFLGDAYVYGCVDGEIFDLLDERKVKEVLFSIR
jgi:Heterokaryon incompatibility protein (HET)